MKISKWYLGLICIVVSGGISGLTNAFDIQLTSGQIEEAKECGVKYKGKEIFYSPTVKTACFGEYPRGEGGLILSKYIKIAVSAAMKAMSDESLTPENIKEIEDSQFLNVNVKVLEDVQAPEDVQIMLIQGTNNILPQKTEFGMKYKDKGQGIIGSFQYEKIDPKASTTIIVTTKKTQKKYKINFSHIK